MREGEGEGQQNVRRDGGIRGDDTVWVDVTPDELCKDPNDDDDDDEDEDTTPLVSPFLPSRKTNKYFINFNAYSF